MTYGSPDASEQARFASLHLVARTEPVWSPRATTHPFARRANGRDNPRDLRTLRVMTFDLTTKLLALGLCGLGGVGAGLLCASAAAGLACWMSMSLAVALAAVALQRKSDREAGRRVSVSLIAHSQARSSPLFACAPIAGGLSARLSSSEAISISAVDDPQQADDSGHPQHPKRSTPVERLGYLAPQAGSELAQQASG